MMSNVNIEGVCMTQLDVISTQGGCVLHAMKKGDIGYQSFGEAYLSTIEQDVIRSWKQHLRMTLNLVVPMGAVKFVLFDDRPKSKTQFKFQEIVLARDSNYARLTVPPLIWVGFQGSGAGVNMILNLADLSHQENEMLRLAPDKIDYKW